jgi:hypothetical protein
MLSRKSNILILSIAALSIFGIFRIYDELSDGFAIDHITYSLPNNEKWETSPPPPQLDAILDQPFTYLGKGSQSYVFLSQDKKYVIKFFKFRHIKPNPVLNALPHIGPIAHWQDYRNARLAKKINRVFNGYKVAHDMNSDDSGLIYVRLNQNPSFDKTIIAYDKLGIEKKIKLDKTIFIIQEAAETTQHVLEEAFQNNDIDLVEKRMQQLIALYLREYQKGVYDKDHAILRNTGFIGERPIHFDVGNMIIEPSIKDPKVYNKDLAILISKLDSWLKENYPDHYDALIAELISSF